MEYVKYSDINDFGMSEFSGAQLIEFALKGHLRAYWFCGAHVISRVFLVKNGRRKFLWSVDSPDRLSTEDAQLGEGYVALFRDTLEEIELTEFSIAGGGAGESSDIQAEFHGNRGIQLREVCFSRLELKNLPNNSFLGSTDYSMDDLIALCGLDGISPDDRSRRENMILGFVENARKAHPKKTDKSIFELLAEKLPIGWSRVKALYLTARAKEEKRQAQKESSRIHSLFDPSD